MHAVAVEYPHRSLEGTPTCISHVRGGMQSVRRDSGCVVFTDNIAKNFIQILPFMATKCLALSSFLIKACV